MRISDWSSDVCSSDLDGADRRHIGHGRAGDLGEEQRDADVDHRQAAAHEADQGGDEVDEAVSDAAGVHDGAGQHEHGNGDEGEVGRSEEHTSELQSLMRLSYAVFCLTKKKKHIQYNKIT